VPSGAQVIDVCAGDGYLYLKYLRAKRVTYLALDASPQMVAWAQRQNISAQLFDVWRDELPTGDCVIMQASLYQFLPRADRIIAKLLAAARDRVIITEPIRNIAASNNPLLAWIGRRTTIPAGEAYTAQRFNPSTLRAVFQSFEAFDRSALLPGGREMIGIFRGQHS
jgi:trans-aconitate methyltransferase